MGLLARFLFVVAIVVCVAGMAKTAASGDAFSTALIAATLILHVATNRPPRRESGKG